MKKTFHTIPAFLLAGIFLFLWIAPSFAQPLENVPPLSLTAPAYVLIEADTGTVIFEKNAQERRPVASVTKLMTMLIVLERLERGEISLDDAVTVSPVAAATTGSTALLDANAVYPLNDLLRATIVASGNDSAVALAEFCAGSEQAFVELMNSKAASLGLTDTVYTNCTGLPAAGHYTSALDVAKVACAVSQYPLYFENASLWLSEIKHPSGRVTDLTNTNRLVRFYTDCDGMKTGSTNEAKYCVAASAKRNGMRLIAVVLGAPSSQSRFDDARAMLDYGFATYKRTDVIAAGELTGYTLPVTRGARDSVDIAVGKGLSMLLKTGQADKLTIELSLPESVQAPLGAGSEVGKVRVLLDGQIVSELPAVLAQDVRLPGYLEGFLRIREQWR